MPTAVARADPDGDREIAPETTDRGLDGCRFCVPDDLERIDGVGPMLRALLHDIGVFYFWQVAEWTNAEIDWVESKLAHFRGRIRRDDWVGQARMMAAAPGAVKRPAQAALRKPL